MSICNIWFDHPDYVNTPHGERPWSGQDFYGSRWHMHFIRVDMAFVTFLDVFETIILHSQLVVLCSENFLSHGVSIGVSAKGSLMNLFDKHVRFISI